MKTDLKLRKIKMYVKHPGALTCGHCKNKGFMKILAGYSERDTETIKSPCGYLVFNTQHSWGVAYELAKCMSCNEITLTKIDWHDDSAPEDYTYTILYPTSHCP